VEQFPSPGSPSASGGGAVGSRGREELPPLRGVSSAAGAAPSLPALAEPPTPSIAALAESVTATAAAREAAVEGYVDEADMSEEMKAMMEEEANKHTMDPHLVMIAAERQIMEAALAAARADARREQVLAMQRSKRTSIIPQDMAHKAALLSFVPGVLQRCISHGLVSLDQWKVLLESPVKSWYDPVLSRFPAAVVFADASGFTKLTETLARQPNGAEHIGKTLNDFFGPLIAIVHQHGGDIIKFSGDALTIIWAAQEPAPPRIDVAHSADVAQMGYDFSMNDIEDSMMGACATVDPLTAKRRAMEAAANCCLQIQQDIHAFGKTPVPGCDLTMHIGVGFADVALLQVGGLLGRWEFCLAGKALDQISIAEPLAHSGETCFSPEAVALASHCFNFESIPGGPGGFAKLLGPKSGRLDVVEPLPWWPSAEDPPDVSDRLKLIKRFIPTSVGICLAGALDANAVAYPEEMRRVSVIFLSIAGLDPFDAASAGDPTAMSGGRMSQLLMRLFQRSVYALEGSVNKFLVDDKGVLLLIVFGLPPLIHLADDPIRAVLCAMRLCDTLADEGLEGHVGVATGHCWCGVVGGNTRREYTVLGDVVNLSARLMGKAAVNGVLVDSTTQEMASQVLQFEDGGELTLKGKAKPVQAFRFVGLRRGLSPHSLEVKNSPLLSWHGWPAHPGLRHALDGLRHRSGVLFITGPGGAGKTELAETTEAWARANGWKLLNGQNMDPTGIFSVPRLPLQEAFHELMRCASRDPFWRSYAQDLIRESLGRVPKKDEQQGEDGSCGPCPQSRRRCEKARRATQEAPRHAELYWMLIAMMRSGQLGQNSISKLQAWAPLLSMVVTDLAFGPGMVAAMAERDEQHAKHNRFAEVCAAVLDGYTNRLEPGVGCMILLHIRRSSAFYQSRDEKESAAIRSLAELCMQRRSNAVDGHESNPVVLCIVSRESVLKDGAVMQYAQQCKGMVPAEDLSEEQTEAFLEHLVRLARDGDTRNREVLARYAFDVAGGNPRGVMTVVRELEERGLLHRTTSGAYTLEDGCGDSQGLRQSIPLPQSLVGMAFSTFETLSPQEQMVLKVASTSNVEFGLRELHSGLQQIEFAALRAVCERLADPKARTLRRVPPRNGSQASPDDQKYRFYSLVLRHVTSTLVLETQRTELRRLTSMGVKLNSAEMEKLQKIGRNQMSVLSEIESSDEEEDGE